MTVFPAYLVIGAALLGGTSAEAASRLDIVARVAELQIDAGTDLGGLYASFLGGSDDETGIRRAAPGAVLIDFLQNSFAGGSTEGTGIRRAAPGVVINAFVGGAAEGTGIRRAAPGVLINAFAGGSQEGTGI
jgi:hypothetical protein